MMSLHHWPRSVLRQAHRPAVEPSVSSNANEEYGREFGEFIESISVTAEELAAIVSMPELSIPEIKQYLRDGKNGEPPNQSIALGKRGAGGVGQDPTTRD